MGGGGGCYGDATRPRARFYNEACDALETGLSHLNYLFTIKEFNTNIRGNQVDSLLSHTLISIICVFQIFFNFFD